MKMSQILVLTKNAFNEQAFEKSLRQLGHEIFISSILIDECLLGKIDNGFIKMFHHVVLSETIDNIEVNELVKTLQRFSIRIHRKSDEQPDEAQLQEWTDSGIDNWIENNQKIEVLREKLSCKKAINEGKIILLPKSHEKRLLSTIHLSSTEMKLFKILYQHQEKIVSREELCLCMWGRKKTNSTMSQLSVLVKHLRDKLAEQNIEGPVIETCWGQGYKLHATVFDQIIVDSKELKYANE